jgi:ATP-binding cassette, subfamily B, bacterial
MAETTKKNKKVPVKEILRQYWRGVKHYKWLFFPSYILFLSAQIISILIPLYYKRFFDSISNATDLSATAVVLINIIIAVLVLKSINWILWRAGIALYNVMESRIMAKLKQNSFDYIIRHSHTFFANTFGGSLVQKVGRFGRSFEALADTIAFNFIPLVITVVGSIVVTWRIEPTVSIILMVWVAIMTTFSLVFSQWKLKYDAISAEADSKTTGYLSDSITNNSAVTFFTGHEAESQGFVEVTNDQSRKQLFSWRLGDVVDAVQTLLMVFVEFFVFYYAIKYWEVGRITVGTFVLAQTYIIGLANQLWGLNRIIRGVYQSFADAKEMVDILITPYEIMDKPDAKILQVEKGEIEFKNVNFDFGKDNQVIENLTVNIKPKEKVAVIGHSGAGKTTFVRLIMRMYDIKSGSIEIDGQDISNVTQDSLRENISFVPQDPALFHRTLMDNIRYGRRDATDEEVIEASKLAHCDDFIDKLPLKYETFVGERGIKLSGGERQRVAIARAILKKAPILIFDEATSSLDSYSESLIQDALENLMKNSTTIVIAHRLSTVKKMDRIIAMQDGKIVEEGTHDELANKENGLYKKLWDLQVGGFL